MTTLDQVFESMENDLKLKYKFYMESNTLTPSEKLTLRNTTIDALVPLNRARAIVLNVDPTVPSTTPEAKA